MRSGVRALAARLPTYLTLKEVKRRWGNAQEDVFPVAQFEKLWGDMTALGDVRTRFVAVPRQRGRDRGQQVAETGSWPWYDRNWGDIREGQVTALDQPAAIWAHGKTPVPNAMTPPERSWKQLFCLPEVLDRRKMPLQSSSGSFTSLRADHSKGELWRNADYRLLLRLDGQGFKWHHNSHLEHAPLQIGGE